LPSLTQDPRFGSQADQQTDKESNPHGYNSIGTKYVDYGLGANPNPAREGLFRKEEFHYDAQNDVYIFPNNQQLHPRYRPTGGEPDQPWNSDEPQHLHVVWAWAKRDASV
jgi:hypothetical protein